MFDFLTDSLSLFLWDGYDSWFVEHIVGDICKTERTSKSKVEFNVHYIDEVIIISFVEIDFLWYDAKQNKKSWIKFFNTDLILITLKFSLIFFKKRVFIKFQLYLSYESFLK